MQINDVTGGGSGGANIYQTGRLGIGAIVDDDPAGGADVGVGDATLVEGDSGYRGPQFTISLSAPQPADVSVQYDVVSGSAALRSVLLRKSHATEHGLLVGNEQNTVVQEGCQRFHAGVQSRNGSDRRRHGI